MDENVKTENVEITTPNTEEPTGDPTPAKSAEEMLAELLAENKRLKKAVDKSSSDASEWKKKFVATQSETEKLSMEKAERDAALREELEQLRKESRVNKYAKSFIAMGYSEDMAVKAAEAQFNGDNDEVLRIQKQYNAEMEKKIRAEIMRSMPAPATGNDEGVQLTQEQFDNLSYREQVDLFEKHPAVYERFAKR